MTPTKRPEPRPVFPSSATYGWVWSGWPSWSRTRTAPDHHHARLPAHRRRPSQCLSATSFAHWRARSPRTRWLSKSQYRAALPSTTRFASSGRHPTSPPAAVGIGLARPGTPVVCIAGDGSTMFGVHAIWTAAQHEVPVVFVVVNNGHYGILKAFAAFQRTPGVPGLDL